MSRRRHYSRLWIAAHPLGMVWLVLDGLLSIVIWVGNGLFPLMGRYAGRGVRAVRRTVIGPSRRRPRPRF